jgi:hypothetical protein
VPPNPVWNTFGFCIAVISVRMLFPKYTGIGLVSAVEGIGDASTRAATSAMA